MTRKLVWALAFSGVVLSGLVLAAGTVAAQQYRGYGYSYDGAPGYYDGGYGGGPYGGQAYDPYAPPPGRGAYQGSYNNDPDPGEPGYRPRSGAQGQAGRGQAEPQGDPRDDAYGDRGFGGRDYGYGYDQGPGYGEPDGGREPGRRASDYDLGENANRTTVTEVENTTHQPPGTIVINTTERRLYLTQANGQALQYGIGVGREGFTWKGSAHVQRKSEWPTWTPPAEMLKRRPDLPTHMEGGIENPLGARALYLFNGKGDTGYRIHGTNEPDTIGKAVSSGCIRMMNADVIDLYRRVSVGTKVVVL